MMVMKENKKLKDKWLHIRIDDTEQKQIQGLFSRSKDRKLSGYLRKVILQKPVNITYHNQSLEDIVTVLTRLQNDLNGIANNYNQAVHKLHTLRDIPEYGVWLITYEQDRKKLLGEIAEIKAYIRKTAELWLQS
jgi:hypothetical protein